MNGSSASSVHRYAIVTGSASGMGLHYARQLAGRGYGLVLVDVNGMALDEQASHLSAEYPVPVLPLCLDLTSNDAADRLLAFCREHKAIVEVLVNNAGILLTSAIADYGNIYPLLAETDFPSSLIMNDKPDWFFSYLGIPSTPANDISVPAL